MASRINQGAWQVMEQGTWQTLSGAEVGGAISYDITKGLAYSVKASPDITKDLEYQVTARVDIQKGLSYLIITSSEIQKALAYLVIIPKDITKGLEYIVNPPPPQEISSGKVVVASDETTATSPEDIDGLTFDITLKNDGYIMAFMSVTGNIGNSLHKQGYFLINIDGVDSPIIERHFHQNKDGNIGVVFRSGLLSPGTYTVKGRHHTEAEVTLTSKNITLVAFPTEDEGGNEIRSVYDTVATDSVVGDTPEDIDGLTQTLTTQALSFVFAMIVGSISATAASIYRLILSTNGKEVDIDRTLTETEDVGVAGLVARTELPEHAGAITVKGKHASEAGVTGTIAPAVLVGLDLSTVSGGTEYVVPSGNKFIEGALLSTTSITLEDIPGAETEVILTQEAHIFAVLTLSSESEKDNKENYFALNINGVDFEECQRTSNGKLDKATITIVARTTSKLAAGTYTIKGRWRTTVGNTLRAINDLSLVAIGLETTTQDLPTHIDRSLDYKIVAPNAITKDLDYTVLTTPAEITKGLEYRVITDSEIAKDLDYEIVAEVGIEKGLKYRIDIYEDVTKALNYSIQTEHEIQKGLQYEIIAAMKVDKGLSYKIVTQLDITKELEYQVSTEKEITKDLEYRLNIQQEIQKALNYTIKTFAIIQRALGYEIKVENEITKSLRYGIITIGEKQLELEYQISSPEILNSLKYTIIIAVGIKKSLQYILQINPYCNKTTPYSKKDGYDDKTSPYSKKDGYEEKDSPYSKFPNKC